MTKLRIRIKEVVEERRKFELDEAFVFKIGNNTDNQSLKDECFEYLYKKGYKDFSAKCGSATFRKETIRDATPKEIRAFHGLEAYKHNDGEVPIVKLEVCEKLKIEAILKGKEIILELI